MCFPNMAVMSEEIESAADARGDHDPTLGGCYKTWNHLPVISFVGMEEEFPNVMHQTHNQSWLFCLIGEKPGIKEALFYFYGDLDLPHRKA